MYCLDRLAEPELEFWNAQRYSKQGVNGSLHYRRVDVRDAAAMDETFSAITKIKNRLDGVIAAAGVNHVANAIDHAPADIEKIMSINYTGTFVTATAAAKQMMQTRTPGSIVLVASISGLITNKGMVSPVYNSSKAAVIQLTRSLAMEWGTTRSGDKLPIRVNCLCPGHTITAMAQMVMARSPGTQVLWESENMLGRLAEPQEFGGAAIFLLSETSTFMTGSTLVIDGGHTAW